MLRIKCLTIIVIGGIVLMSGCKKADKSNEEKVRLRSGETIQRTRAESKGEMTTVSGTLKLVPVEGSQHLPEHQRTFYIVLEKEAGNYVFLVGPKTNELRKTSIGLNARINGYLKREPKLYGVKEFDVVEIEESFIE